jgi:NADH:ubiquinone oxidoreductase subunit 6 (subunit J)
MFWTFAVTAISVCSTHDHFQKPGRWRFLRLRHCTLGTCGLFMLQSAPFLAAATIIVYAGAVIVTFLFVITPGSSSRGACRERVAAVPSSPFLRFCSSFVLRGLIVRSSRRRSRLKVETH